MRQFDFAFLVYLSYRPYSVENQFALSSYHTEIRLLHGREEPVRRLFIELLAAGDNRGNYVEPVHSLGRGNASGAASSCAGGTPDTNCPASLSDLRPWNGQGSCRGVRPLNSPSAVVSLLWVQTAGQGHSRVLAEQQLRVSEQERGGLPLLALLRALELAQV
jgi:hypothetical protein